MPNWGKNRCTSSQRANFLQYKVSASPLRKRLTTQKENQKSLCSQETQFPGKEVQMALKQVKRCLMTLSILYQCSYIFPPFRLIKVKVLFLFCYVCVVFFFDLGKSVRTEAIFYVAWYEQKNLNPFGDTVGELLELLEFTRNLQ